MTTLPADSQFSTVVTKVADLARLELSDEETRGFGAQLGGILAYMDLLSDADVQGVEPLTHPLELATPLRADRVIPSPIDSEGRSKVLASAPETLYDGYKVPPIL